MADQFTQFGMRTGHVDLADWDLGVIKQTGAIYDSAQNEFYLPLSMYLEDPALGPVEIERALVVYKRPEPTQVQAHVPQIAIIRDDIDPDEGRLFSPTVQYRLPAPGATPICAPCGPDGEVGIGYNCYETKDKEDPYTFTYTIEVWARYRIVAQQLLQIMMKQFPIRGTFVVVAGEDGGRNVECDRTYLFFQEGITNLTEVNSMVERIPGFGLTIRVEGELTLGKEPFTTSAFTGQTSETPPFGVPVCPDLPGNGLYGTGAPNVRATPLED